MEKHKIKEILNTLCRVLEEVPEIRYVGDGVLRIKAQAVEVLEGNTIVDQLGKVLLRYRETSGIGRGLAAPQIGINKAVFVIFVDDKIQAFLNPKILERSKETNFFRELCISSGVMAADVERSEWVIMEWTDQNGKTRKEKFEGFLARLLQHEEAHLRGVVNLDEASPKGIQFVTFDPSKEILRNDR